MKKRILALCGISGTGKTTLREKLVKEPEFFTMVQVTTRSQRDGESPESYIFLTNNQYKYIEANLVGKMEFLGNRYGTLMSPNNNGIGVIILNEPGLRDFKKHFKNKDDVQTIVVGLDKDMKTLEVTREGRGVSELMKEKRVIQLCDEVITLGDGEYATVEMVKDILKKNNMID